MENANNSTELPEICKKYDEVSDAMVTYKSDIESMENEVIEKTEKVKEYLQILKTGSEAGINKETTHEMLEDGTIRKDTIIDLLSYYRRKVSELNYQLLKIDDELISKKANLQDYNEELEEITKLIPESGMTKIYYSGLTIGSHTQWITKEQWANNYKNQLFYTRIV